MNRKLAAVILTAAMTAAAAAPAAAEVSEDIWQYGSWFDENGDEVFDFKEINVTLPASWGGCYGFEVFGPEVIFYQSASMDAALADDYSWGGTLFSIICSANHDFEDYLPNYQIIGDGEEGLYYVTQPTDFQAYPEDDEEVVEEYRSMQEDVPWIIANIEITNPGEGAADAEEDGMEILEEEFWDELGEIDEESDFILEESSERLLTDRDIRGLDANQLQMAINEIYARHHRRFNLQSVQDYFESFDWYTGTIDADRFNPNTLSEIEDTNIAFMLQRMRELATDGMPVRGTVMYAMYGLNIRNAASMEGAIIGGVPQGYSVIVTGDSINGWAPVSFNGVKGYIYDENLSKTKPY